MGAKWMPPECQVSTSTIIYESKKWESQKVKKSNLFFITRKCFLGEGGELKKKLLKQRNFKMFEKKNASIYALTHKMQMHQSDENAKRR